MKIIYPKKVELILSWICGKCDKQNTQYVERDEICDIEYGYYEGDSPSLTTIDNHLECVKCKTINIVRIN